MSLLVGIWKDGVAHGWLEGVTIIAAVVIIVCVTAGNNYVKEMQFQKLNAIAKDISVPVTRSGKMKNLSVFSLLVGDII